MEVIYLAHPVSPEQKAEARKRGQRIVDATYAPAGYAQQQAGGEDSEAACDEKPRRGRPPKVDTGD